MKEMDVTLSRSERQTTDWLAVGKFAGKYVIMNTPERMNSTPVLNLFKEILKP